jgi:hypothetical protein
MLSSSVAWLPVKTGLVWPLFLISILLIFEKVENK